jgi:hypothetical protein
MQRINIQIEKNSFIKYYNINIEVCEYGVLNSNTENEQVIVAYYNKEGTYNDSIFLTDGNFNIVHEFNMTDQIIKNPKNKRQNLTSLMFSPDSTLLWIINDDTCYIYNTTDYTLVHTWLNDKNIHGFSMSNDNKKVAFIDNSIVYIYENGKELFSYKSEHVLYTVFSQNSHLVMSYSLFLNPQNNIKIHNSFNGDLLYDFIMTEPIRVINFTPDNNIIFFKGISHDNETFESDFNIWDIKENKVIKKIENEHLNVNNISFSNDGKYMYCELVHKGLNIYDTTNDKIVKRYYNNYDSLYTTYTSNYKYIILSNKDKQFYNKLYFIL